MTEKKFEEWYWLNDKSVEFLRNGYIPEDKDIKQHFKDIADKAERILDKPGYSKSLLENISKGWYLLPTPGITNFLHDTESGISCFGSYCADSVEGLLYTDAEIGMLSKIGGGTSVDLSDIRKKGAPIRGGGFADGLLRYIDRLQDTTGWITQRSRRGKVAVYYDVESPEINEFLSIKDKTSSIHEIPFGVKIGDNWIKSLKEGDKLKRDLWAKIIRKKFETGFPYILFKDNINNNLVDIYNLKDKKVNNSNLCTEILLSNSHTETFVCCISAMNLVHYDEWKDTNAIEILLYLLEAFLLDFINKNKDNPLMQRSVKFAREQMAVGIGASGWHSYLQLNMIPLESIEAKFKNTEIFKHIKLKSYEASIKLAKEYGRPPIFENTDIFRHNTTLNAIAPNTSSSEIFGQWSQSIEPLYSNYYIAAKAKNKYAVKNKILEDLLISKDMNTEEVWESIKNNNGSVQHLDFLSELEKNVFKTFIEISPMELLIQNATRQKFIDQGISFNTMIPFGTPAKDVSDYYLKAHELGIKTLYYQLNQNAAQRFTRSILECDTCAG